MEISDKHKCYFCKRPFQWSVHVYEGSSDGYDPSEKEGEGTVVATGVLSTTAGPRVSLEVTVKCPYCCNLNKMSRTMEHLP